MTAHRIPTATADRRAVGRRRLVELMSVGSQAHRARRYVPIAVRCRPGLLAQWLRRVRGAR